MLLKVVCLFIVLTASKGWEIGKRYEYNFGTKILQDGKETKVLASAFFRFRWDSENLLTGKFIPKYVKDDNDFSDFIAIPKDVFQAVFNSGQVTELKVSEDTSQWQVEFIRGALGLLQVSDLVQEKDEFFVVEESVAGKCNTFYNVKRAQGIPGLIIEKTRNYTDCEKTPVFERGVFGSNNYDVLMKKRDIITRDTKIGIIMSDGNEIDEASLEEDIKIISEKNTVVFSTKTALWSDDTGLEIFSTYDNDFEVFGNLISVGGLMYRPKPQKAFCHKQFGLQRNEIESSCEADYYMNPKQFDTSYKGMEMGLTKTMVEKIAEELGTPSEIPKTNTLDRFTVLVEVIRSMNEREIEMVFGDWDPSSNQAFVFLSAVLQTGTLESLKALQILKQANKIRSDMTGFQMIPEKVHPLTLEYLEALFEFATDPKLVENDFVFSKNLFIGFSNLLRRYSTETEKSFKKEQLDKLILKKYRKYLSDKLQNSISNLDKDDMKLQVYIRAMGNMADMPLINYFWTTSSSKLTPFQKTLVVNSMDYAVEMYPEKSRTFLMKIYESSEPHSVRTAAAYQLFKTNLPEDMVSKIIRVAKDSGNGHIQNAVKSAVLSEGYEYYKNDRINEMAQSIEVTKEETQGATNKFSELRFQNDSNNVQKTSNFVELILGMDENPLSIFAYEHLNKRGFQSYIKVGGMIDQFRSFVRGLTTSSFYETLLLQASSGNFELDKDFSQIFIPFENVLTSPMDIVNLLQDDKQFSYELLQIYDEVAIGFPTESGFPFLYTYQIPVLRDFEVATHVGKGFKVEFNLIYSSREQTKMGFVNPMVGKHYVYGMNVEKQLNVPLSISYDSYGSTYIVTIDPLFRQGNQRLVHLATWPYAGERDLFPVKPINEDKDIKTIAASDLFTDELASDDSNTFLLKVVSTELETGADIVDFAETSEMQSYTNEGPFGEVKPTRNEFQLFFKDDPDHPLSLIVKVDLSSTKTIMSQRLESAGKIRGPFYFMGKALFNGDIELTGPTNHSVSLEISQHTDLIGNALKFSWQGSYSQNGEKLYETCMDTFMKQRMASSYYFLSSDNEDDNPKMDIFINLKTGETCDDPEKHAFISAETEIDPNTLDETSDINLNVTLDFGGFCDEISKQICEFEGDSFPGKETMTLNLTIMQKDQEKCDALAKDTEDIATEKNLGDPDAEIIDMLAME